ncbi:pentapeptide repeat-containing protein [Candidatus Uabimicrobium sp. HlEnr_7]|uniref:pentapeptide repeat-containing protein n=1 Tax=Candidatus Uabimicrobium helgolandensis TaxID=3095367 RepID=UPI0035562DFC
MVQFNFFRRSVNIKLVLYGPEMAGKTTTFEKIHDRTPMDKRSDLVTISTESDRTIFTAITPQEKINGMDTKIRMFAVPGKVRYKSTKRLVLQGANGVIFVADSQKSRFQDNIDSWEELLFNIKDMGLDENIPIAILWNKRDLENLTPVEELEQQINKLNYPSFEVSACSENNIYECFDLMARECGQNILQTIDSKVPRKVKKPVHKEAINNPKTERMHISNVKVIEMMLRGEAIRDVSIAILDISDEVFKEKVYFENVVIDKLIGNSTHFLQEVRFKSVEINEMLFGGEYLSELEKKLARDEEFSSPTKFSGSLILEDVVINCKADFDVAHFDSYVLLYNVKMPKREGKKATIEDFIVSFRDAQFFGDFEISDCQIRGLDVRDAVFGGEVKIEKCKFSEETIFGALGERSGAIFKNSVKMKENCFAQKAEFQGTHFSKDLQVFDCKFECPVFWGESHFSHQTLFFRCHFAEKARFSLSTFDDEVYFAESNFVQGIEWIKSKFRGKLFANDAVFGKLDMEGVRLEEGADFTKAAFGETNFSYAVFRGATTFHSAVFNNDCRFYAAIFDSKVSFDKTKFNGMLSLAGMSVQDMAITWGQVDGKLLSVVNKNYVDAAEEYSLLKNIFERQNRYDDQDEAYLRYKQTMRKTLKISLLHPWQTLTRMMSFLTLDLGCGYGTRPFRITFTSIVIALTFALCYSYFPNEFIYSGVEKTVFDWSNAAYFSIATFTTMGFGDWAPKPNSVFRYVVTIEAFVGIFTMALFVGAFTRKVIR